MSSPSAMRVVVDTNILIDYLNEIPGASEELDRYEIVAISHMTWMEVLAGTHSADEARTRDFLATFELQPIDAAVAERAVRLRRAHRIRLPDAIIWATAQSLGVLFVT